MKRQYTKPTTAHIKAELHQMITASPGVGDGKGLGEGYNAGDQNYSKQFDFVTEGEQAWKNEYPAFSLWED